MEQIVFKAEREITLSVRDQSLSGVLGERSKKDDTVRVLVQTEWNEAVNELRPGCECIVSQQNDHSVFEEHKMILIETELKPGKRPVLFLKYFKSSAARGDLRRDKRFKTFILTEISELNDDFSLDNAKPLLNGTIQT